MSLLPCPHCGGKARCLSMQVAFSHHMAWRAYCDTTECTYGLRRNTEAEAVAAWNTRAETTRQASVEEAAVRMAGRGMENPRAVWDRWPEATKAHYLEMAAAALGVTP